jgi:DNA mismatch repair ATPase MutS
MRSGKLDEELSRMSSLVDKMTPNSIVLLNESFASTNEREGSEIARQIVRALLESGIKVFYVTHMFDLAQGFYCSKIDTAQFLRAERLTDGRRTFRLVEGEPLPTSHGEDLYKRIFGVQDVTTTAPPSGMRLG